MRFQNRRPSCDNPLAGRSLRLSLSLRGAPGVMSQGGVVVAVAAPAPAQSRIVNLSYIDVVLRTAFPGTSGGFEPWSSVLELRGNRGSSSEFARDLCQKASGAVRVQELRSIGEDLQSSQESDGLGGSLLN
ncbi:hypothetical protein PVAR5_8387 [Paecilomyces variotii No. 5]|uniref:Uncharacterized protein n=1 Tax=Byssochlamys spectabilis (strain No. 5 / NBRC 109023) TaxID=1356009 RepID=V5G5C0_BYSSN|nr:hypothetical protein PVAR5_8387 [Paecilomyces variotii No. 5]